jgi:hypothetical protein
VHKSIVKLTSSFAFARFGMLWHDACADVALVLNQEGPICGVRDSKTDEPSEQEMRHFVKRVLLQRQQEVEDEDSDFND